ncbi:carbon storage regulator [Legionella lytica]|uniref:Carbon storage regulator n=1 Tax=Legionella lytica TaxID=96232 RepID=A0ABW8DEJ0_9GAMM
MELTNIEFEGKLIIVKDNQKIEISPFRAQDGNIKLGITAPRGIGVDREEIFIRKQQMKEQVTCDD